MRTQSNIRNIKSEIFQNISFNLSLMWRNHNKLCCKLFRIQLILQYHKLLMDLEPATNLYWKNAFSIYLIQDPEFQNTYALHLENLFRALELWHYDIMPLLSDHYSKEFLQHWIQFLVISIIMIFKLKGVYWIMLQIVVYSITAFPFLGLVKLRVKHVRANIP